MAPPVDKGGSAVSLRALYLAFLALVTALPFACAHILGLGDSLNHLARIHILESIGQSPALHRFYSVHWAPIPYLAMDGILPWLSRLTGLYAALKLFVLACVLLPFAAVLALRQAAGERFSANAGGALLLGANYSLGLGFLNYVFVAGIAMLAFAAWLKSESWGWRIRLPCFVAVSLLLYFGHAFGFLAYGCAVAGYELARAFRRRWHPAGATVRELCLAAAQALPVLVFATTLNTKAGAAGALYSHWGDAGEKLLAFTSPVLFLNDPIQHAILGAGLLALIVSGFAARLSPALWPAAAASLAVAICVPEILLSTWLTDFRLPLTTAILFVASISFRPTLRFRPLLYAALAILVCAKSADIWRVLTLLDAQESELHRVLASLPEGARLLVVNQSQQAPGSGELGGSTIWSMPLMAVIERDAFLPTLFTGVTTVHAQPDFAAQSTPQGMPTTLARLDQDLRGVAPTLSPEEKREGLTLYWHDWPHRFDYVLVEHVHALLPQPVPTQFVPVALSEDFALYAITVSTSAHIGHAKNPAINVR